MNRSSFSQVSLVDTHCHLLHMLEKEAIAPLSSSDIHTLQEFVNRAEYSQVTTIIEVSTTITESTLALEVAQLFNNVYPVIGVHPCEARADWKENFEQLSTLMKKNSHLIVGVGECGFDKYHPGYSIDYQTNILKAQIELALEYNKALVVHTRNAEEETYRTLEQYKHDLKRVTIHCFSNSLSFAQEVTSWGFKLGIGGTVTYPKNNLLRTIVQTVGLENIVLETDAPFLAPQVIRGKKNGPENIKLIAEFLAELFNSSLETVAAITTTNAQKLFLTGEIVKEKV